MGEGPESGCVKALPEKCFWTNYWASTYRNTVVSAGKLSKPKGKKCSIRVLSNRQDVPLPGSLVLDLINDDPERNCDG